MKVETHPVVSVKKASALYLRGGPRPAEAVPAKTISITDTASVIARRDLFIPYLSVVSNPLGSVQGDPLDRPRAVIVPPGGADVNVVWSFAGCRTLAPPFCAHFR